MKKRNIKKILIVLLLNVVMLTSCLPPAQAAPLIAKAQIDDTLYAALVAIYNEANHPDLAYGDPIPSNAFDQTTQVYFNNRGLTSLRGLDCFSFSDLEELSLSGNRLADLSGFPSSLPVLEFLSLANNRLTTLNGLPNTLPKLKEMNLSGNLFTALSAMPQNLPALNILDISENSLSGNQAFNGFPTLPELTEFSLAGNGLTSLAAMPPAALIPSLQVLEVASNNIATLASMPNYTVLPLQICNLSNNQLTDLTGVDRLRSTSGNSPSAGLNLSIGGNDINLSSPQNIALLQNLPDVVLVTVVPDDDSDDGNSDGIGGGTASGVGTGAPTPGGDNTRYNQSRLLLLNSLTQAQRDAARFPGGTSTVSPGALAMVTLTTQDGLSLLISPRTLANEKDVLRFTVAVGTVTTPPQANTSLVVLDPVRYQRQFGLEGRAEGTIQFQAPVIMRFLINLTDLPSGVNVNQLAVYRWEPDRKDWLRCGGDFDPAENTLSVPSYHFSTYAVMAETQKNVTRIAGSDRFSTANAVAVQGWRAGADTVIIANGYSFADALAAAPLAFKYNAPVLLTEADKLTTATMEEIKRLKPKRLMIIGGTGVISQAVQNSLNALCGSDNVTRYSGEDRYGTAQAIAAALGTTGQAVVVSGGNANFADALAISSYAAYNGIPILFSNKNKIPTATAQALTAQAVKSTIVVGGTGAVSDHVMNTLPAATRYGGKDRYETAMILAKELHMNLNRIFVATGRDFPDALVAGAYAAQSLSPILMVDNGIPASVSGYLRANNTSINYLTEIGGEGVITPDQEIKLQDLIK